MKTKKHKKTNKKNQNILLSIIKIKSRIFSHYLLDLSQQHKL